MENNNTQQPKNNKNMLYIIIALVAIVGIAAFALMGKGGSSDKNLTSVEKLMEAYKNSMNMKQIDGDLTVKGSFETTSEDPSEQAVAELLNKISLTANVKVDMDTNQVEEAFKLNVEDQELVSAAIYIDDKIMAGSVPLLFEGWAYGEVEKINELSGQSFNFGETMKNALELYDFSDIENIDAVKEKYLTFAKENIDPMITVENGVEITDGYEKAHKTDKYTIVLTPENSLELVTKFVEIAKDDEDLKNVIIAKVDDYMDYMAKSTGLPQDQLDMMFADLVEAKKEIQDNYVEGMNEVYTALTSEEMEIPEELKTLNLEISFYLENKNIVAQDMGINFDMDQEGTTYKLNITMNQVINKINEKIDFTAIDLENGYNLTSEDGEDANKLMQEAQGNFMTNILFNPDFQNLFQAFEQFQ
ncbi:MAG: hypothetical protein N4A76_05880 [Firmicutes bacterium]|nr:hypothetical protein [Bacillota bacterium]